MYQVNVHEANQCIREAVVNEHATPIIISQQVMEDLRWAIGLASERASEHADAFLSMAQALRDGKTVPMFAEGENGAQAAEMLANHFIHGRTRLASIKELLIDTEQMIALRLPDDEYFSIMGTTPPPLPHPKALMEAVKDLAQRFPHRKADVGYANNAEPCCIIGTALCERFDYTVDHLRTFDDIGRISAVYAKIAPHYVNSSTDHEIGWLDDVQRLQDDGQPWGYAAANAKGRGML